LPEEAEIEMLIRKAKRRLDAAHHLLGEGFYEDAVSRAYYSMYFAAKALLLKRDITVKIHKGLLSKFGLEYYGRALRIAEELREEADYSINSCGAMCRGIQVSKKRCSGKDTKTFIHRECSGFEWGDCGINQKLS